MNSRKINILAAVLIASVLLLTASIGTVYAYLSAKDVHTDTFAPATSIDPSVVVTSQTGTATASVTVPNAGYPVYVRAAVVVNWINKENGKICATPKDATYSVDADGWTKPDEPDELDDFYYYYYNLKVNSLESEFKVTYTEVYGYDVQVQVIAQTIQAVGTVDNGTNNTAVFDAWGVNMP